MLGGVTISQDRSILSNHHYRSPQITMNKSDLIDVIADKAKKQ